MISGTPATGTGATAGQSYPLTLTVKDSGTPQQTQTFSPTLIIYNGVAISTTSFNTGFVGHTNTTYTIIGGGRPGALHLEHRFRIAAARIAAAHSFSDGAELRHFGNPHHGGNLSVHYPDR